MSVLDVDVIPVCLECAFVCVFPWHITLFTNLYSDSTVSISLSLIFFFFFFIIINSPLACEMVFFASYLSM